MSNLLTFYFGDTNYTSTQTMELIFVDGTIYKIALSLKYGGYDNITKH